MQKTGIVAAGGEKCHHLLKLRVIPIVMNTIIIVKHGIGLDDKNICHTGTHF